VPYCIQQNSLLTLRASFMPEPSYEITNPQLKHEKRNDKGNEHTKNRTGIRLHPIDWTQ
jgi:hypothetical protein